MKNKTDRKYYIVALSIVVLTISVGFALFSEVLNITGTATASGTFNVEFSSATVGTSSFAGTPTVVVSPDKNTLTLTASTLEKPGATVTYNVTVKNVGSIAANLASISITGNTDPDVTVSHTAVANQTIAANATYDFTITVAWPSASVLGNKTINYTVGLVYNQV